MAKSEAPATTITLDADGADVDPEQQTNAISTTRFTWYSWIPKSLLLQMRRLANVYFVTVAVLACTPWWGGRAINKVGMVCLVLTVQACKDLYEDLLRRKDDQKENSKIFMRYDFEEGTFEKSNWQDCEAGDVIMVRCDEGLPADTLILASSDPVGLCYVSTAGLDGETNLKQRRAMAVTQELMKGCVSPEEAASNIANLFESGLELTIAAPTAELSDMDGSLTLADGQPIGVQRENFGLRGSMVRNTSWCIGVVCYVGDNTKVILNSAGPPSKTSELERFLNYCVIALVLFIIGVSILFGILSRFSDGYNGMNPCIVFVRYFIILYNVLPMSLYIMFEFLKTFIGHQIDIDPDMRDEETREFTKARNTSVVEELGQVNFVFSDKTGTLTANEMRFSHCCIGAKTLGPFLSDQDTGEVPAATADARAVLGGRGDAQTAHKDFFQALAVCHTVACDKDGKYQGESPDEVALARAAHHVGVSLVKTESGVGGVKCHLETPWGAVQFQVAHIVEFNSDRKRMTAVCPNADGSALVITKGADSVMEGLLCDPLPQASKQGLHAFARDGLRTLIIGQRTLDGSSYSSWRQKWERAGAAMEGRSEQQAAVAAEIEKGLTYVGVTALEDRLQDDVPTTIAALRHAGICVWVLTGDKVETAVEIAKSCRLIESNMKLVRILGESSFQDALAEQGSFAGTASRCIIIDGASAGRALEDDDEADALYELARSSTSCVCCRLSPLQKRMLIELVRERDHKAITLAIGDGANDVPMIQGAHLGIGIRGKEGAASVRASDVAISQFKFMGRLVFDHGRKAYRRVATYLCYFTYKSVVVMWGYVIFAFSCHFQGALGYPEWLDIVYNGVTSASVVMILTLDKDYTYEEVLAEPELYHPGPNRAYLNVWGYAKWLVFGSWHGILAWTVPVHCLSSASDRELRTRTFWCASLTAFTVVVLIVHYKLLLIALKPISRAGIAMVVAELVGYVVAVVALCYGHILSSHLGKLAPQLHGVPAEIAKSWPHVACLIFVPIVALIPDVIDMLLMKHATNCDDGETESEDEAEDCESAE